MLAHHSSQSYETAVGRMAENVRTKFEKTIADGAANAQKVLERLDREIIRDRVVGSRAVKFVPAGKGVDVMVEDETQTIHDHALGQICGRVKMPLKYLRNLQERMAGGEEDESADTDWARELIAHNLNTLYHEGPGLGSKYLMRSVDTETRGWLSDKFRRLDCRPLLAAFHESAIVQTGAVPTRAYNLATKVAIRVVLPTVFEPIPNHPMLYGLEWHNSDYGHGMHTLRAFVHEPWCTNEMTRDDVLRQVHVGQKLTDDINFSNETYAKDQETSVLALRDMVQHLLEPAAVDGVFARIKEANDTDMDENKVKAFLKKHLRKGEAEKVQNLFDSNDTANMVEGKSKLRLSDAISFTATNTDNRYRALELERLAGKLVA